ncbi:MAG: cytidine deaminase [Chitinophagaceae bacterium]|nr:cytidine deaminase [Chitinophagaceae bacterium]
MDKHQYSFDYEVYDSISQLNEADAALLRAAQETAGIAYAPYSNFHVGAVARLANGQTVRGSNQENASYPVGLCAERVLLSAASSVYPGVAIDTIAISYNSNEVNSNRPISPCGICRQTLVEYETHLNHPIRLVLGGMKGKVFVIPKASLLLPFGFSGEDMK